MRLPGIALSIFLAAGLISCNREDTAKGDDAARKAGRDAYHAAQQAKRDIKQAEHDIEHASKSFRDGWNEARSSDKTRRDDRDK